MTVYRTFKRSARNFEEFSRATKITDKCGLTYDEARRRCRLFNDDRTSAQVKSGLKMEFEGES